MVEHLPNMYKALTSTTQNLLLKNNILINISWLNKINKKRPCEPGVLAHACKLRTEEAEVGRL